MRLELKSSLALLAITTPLHGFAAPAESVAADAAYTSAVAPEEMFMKRWELGQCTPQEMEKIKLNEAFDVSWVGGTYDYSIRCETTHASPLTSEVTEAITALRCKSEKKCDRGPLAPLLGMKHDCKKQGTAGNAIIALCSTTFEAYYGMPCGHVAALAYLLYDKCRNTEPGHRERVGGKIEWTNKSVRFRPRHIAIYSKK